MIRNEIKIIGIEKDFETEISFGKEKYKIRGKIDRIDEIDGEIRVIDYKSGKKLFKGDLMIRNSEELREEKGIYNLQLLVYMIGISKELGGVPMKSGIINLKNMKDGFLEGKFNGICSSK